LSRGSHKGVIYCIGHGGGSNGWSFPVPIARKLQRELEGLSVLHLFGGKSLFGTRIDTDPITSPDVIADAWLPPFAKDSFDAVVLDPPYVAFGRHCRYSLGINAAWIAKKYVIWVSSFAATSIPGCSIDRWWTVIVGNDCGIRQLAFFSPRVDKREPERVFTRGPAMRYNRWLAQPNPLPFEQVV
jgi:hypothetical protein